MGSRKSKKAEGYLPSPNDAGIRPCPFSREEFLQRARSIKVTMEYAGQVITFYLSPKEFTTGSYGYTRPYSHEKIRFDIDGVPCIFQNSTVLTMVGSGKMDGWIEWIKQQEGGNE